MDLKKQDFYYDLPENLIAQTPVMPRDSSNLLSYDLQSGSTEHLQFRDIFDKLQLGDVLVVNNTRVIYARLFGHDGNGREYELLLLKRLNLTQWECLIKPAKKAKIGSHIVINEHLKLQILGIIDNGIRIIEFSFNGVFEEILSKVGNIPLPPYITEKLIDNERYQTVYSKFDGSSAAPTAGLHFTDELLQMIKNKGVQIVTVLLHVGLGTFRPVKVDNVLEHKMHEEYYEVSKETADIINRAKQEKRRIIAVGTTSVRTLESVANDDGTISCGSGYTDIFLYPPYKMKVVDGLITNFHLPESTLLMLVSCLIGREKLMELYKIAVDKKYRFFSFGDAMLLL